MEISLKGEDTLFWLARVDGKLYGNSVLLSKERPVNDILLAAIVNDIKTTLEE